MRTLVKNFDILEANLNATGNRLPFIVQSADFLKFADFALNDLPAKPFPRSFFQSTRDRLECRSRTVHALHGESIY